MAISKVTAGGIADIAAALEAASDSNKFTDDDHNKLNAIEGSATADQTKSDIEGLGIDLPAANLTGTIVAARLSTATTQAESDNTTKLATTAYVTSKITTLIGGAPSTLNDLNELALAINDDANYNSTLTTALGTKMPKAGGAFTGAVTTNSTFDGVDIATRDGVLTSTTATAAAALPKAGGTMTGDLNFGDNDVIQMGAGNDLRIYHDGSNSYIDDADVGKLHIRSNEILLQKYTGETLLQATADGAVSLNHDNSVKFATTAAGVDVTGNVTAGVSGANANNYQIKVLAGTTGLSRFIAGDGSDAGYLDYTHNGDKWSIKTAGAERLEINNAGIDVTGNVVVSGTVDGVDIQTLNTTASAALPKAGGTMTGQLKFIDGTASAPGISNTDDPNTGIYFPAADNIGFTTGGVARGFWSATQLNVTGNGVFSGNITVGGTVDGRDIAARDNVLTSTTTTANAALPKAGGTMTGDLIITKTSGDVSLTLYASEDNGAREPSLNLKGYATNSNPVIKFGDHAGYAGAIEYENSDNSMRLYTNDSEKMRIDSSGNLGIGTSSPISLTGNAEPGLTVASNGPYICLQDANNANTVRYISNNDGQLQFGLVNDDGSTSKTEHMRITSDGRGLSAFTAKGWVRFNGTTINDSHNVSAVEVSATGQYRVNWDVDFANANYAVAGMGHADRLLSFDGAANAAYINLNSYATSGSREGGNYESIIAFGS